MNIPHSFAGDAGYARVGPLLPLLSILEEAGVSSDTAFRRAGLSPNDFHDPDNRISFEAAGRLLEVRFPRFFVCQRAEFMLAVFPDAAL